MLRNDLSFIVCYCYSIGYLSVGTLTHQAHLVIVIIKLEQMHE